MAITRTAMVDDDGSGTTGTIINNAWKTEFYNQIDGALGGGAAWVDVAFSAANFTTPTAGAAWTVTSASYSYAVSGKVVIVTLAIDATATITGAPLQLKVTLPSTPNRRQASVFSYSSGGVTGVGVALITPGDTGLLLQRDVVAPAFGAGSQYLYLQISYSIA